MTYKRIFISEFANDTVRTCLSELSERLVYIKSNPSLPEPVSAHADMQMLMIDDTLVITKELYDILSSQIPDNIIIAFAENNHTVKYPGDVNLNALYLGNKLFAKASSLDATVKKICFEKNIDIINVKQGYARCSVLPVGESAIITSDTGIAVAAKQNGFDVLVTAPGQIVLPGYDYGFIGGASFYDHFNRTVYFFGDIKKHSDYKRIAEFCACNNIKVNISDDFPLTDLGGAVAI